MLDVLLELGADVNLRNFEQYTALHYAVIHGHEQVVKTLINKGAEIDATNDLGFTPLIYVAQGKVMPDFMQST